MTTPHLEIFNVLDGRRSSKADALHRSLVRLGIDFATGVPCGVLKHIIENVSRDPVITHVPANRESEAVGIAAGAMLAGRMPLVYTQNSGFFAASNDIASLLIPYKLPILFAVTHRGCADEDAVQHLVTGATTETLLRSFGLPFETYGGENSEERLVDLWNAMAAAQRPAVLLFRKGWNQ